jgi:hypothetical protein
MNTRISLVSSALLSLTAFAATAANAAELESVSLQFESGASFAGIVTLSDDYTSVLGVSGTLTGYSYQAFTYVGGATSDPIDWVLNPGINYSVTPNTFETFLLDGPPGDYTGINNQLILTYDYTAAPTLVLSDADLGNNANYTDAAVAGSISPVPLPGAIVSFGTALGILGVLAATGRTRNQIA